MASTRRGFIGSLAAVLPFAAIAANGEKRKEHSSETVHVVMFSSGQYEDPEPRAVFLDVFAAWRYCEKMDKEYEIDENDDYSGFWQREVELVK